MRLAANGFGSLYVVGMVVMGLGLSVVALDAPLYFTAQAELQTATDAAALAGAQALPDGYAHAEAAALELLAENPVAGQVVSADNVTFDYDRNRFEVVARTSAPTLIKKFLCGMAGSAQLKDTRPSDIESDSGSCDFMPLQTHSKAIPVARDTILVIDTSNSMDDLGSNQPFNDVKRAAKAYITKILEMDTKSADRIAVVSFDQGSALRAALTSQQDSNAYASVSRAIDQLRLFSGSGWNTNFEAGLRVALNEMASRGRANSSKNIIFMTDGYPNLPEGSTRMSTCTTHQNNGNNLWRQRRFTQANQQYALAQQCAQRYVNHMVGETQKQIDRAEMMDVTVHVIQIGGDDSSSLDLIRDLLNDDDWDSGLQQAMVDTTDGDYYSAASYDSQGILEIYEQVAMNVRMRLAS